MRLSRFDLNLLVVFEALMTERNVGRAADRLALSQPATSHALGRLRILLDDKLFVRTSAGMEPTARALQLAVPIRRALQDVQQALEPDTFDPATAEGQFVIAINNHAALVLATPLINAGIAVAPAVRLDLRPSGTLEVEVMLDRGDLDFAITARAMDGQRFGSCVLMRDDLQLVMRASHPDAGTPLTLAGLSALPRVELSSSGEDVAFVDRALLDAGLPVRIVAAVPYLALPGLLRSTDLVAIVRRQVAQTLARLESTVAIDLPIDSGKIDSVLSWHHRHSGRAAYLWMRELIVTTANAII